MRSFVLTLALLTACAPGRPFDRDDWSMCGAVAAGDEHWNKTWLDGKQLREAETALLYSLARHSKLDLGQGCAALAGLKVHTRATPCWTDQYGRSVCGLSWCQYGVVEVGTPPHWPHWSRSTLTHELVHVMQGCNTPGEVDPGMDDDHSNWERLGINEALRQLETLP